MKIALLLLAASATAVLGMPSHHARKLANATMPHEFGNYTLSSCSDAPPCGTVMTSIDGTNAYSNGANQCTGDSCGGSGATGSYYQCVELGQRYFNDQFGIQPIWPVDYALQMCDNIPAGVSTTGSPGHGNLVVFNWAPYGHVAVIDSYDGTYVYVVEQNGSPTGTNTYPASEAACFLTA
jgi:hypothetical protein